MAYLGTPDITESIVRITRIKETDFTKEKPTQAQVLDKLWDKGLDPESVHNISMYGHIVSEALLKFGLQLKSLKQAGVRPSALLGIERIIQGPEYDENGDMYFQPTQKIRWIDVNYLTSELEFTESELKEDGIPKNILEDRKGAYLLVLESRITYRRLRSDHKPRKYDIIS